MQTSEDLSLLIREYSSTVSRSQDDEIIKRTLIRDADWTERGAEELVYIAKRYGSFMLRNALALSVALGIEDGEAGF